MFYDLDLPSQRRLDPLAEALLLVSAIGPNQLETRKGLFERRKQELAATVVLDIGFMDLRTQNQPIRIDQQVALAIFPLSLLLRYVSLHAASDTNLQSVV